MLLKTDTEELFLVGDVPEADLVSAPNGKDLAKTCWKADLGDRICH